MHLDSITREERIHAVYKKLREGIDPTPIGDKPYLSYGPGDNANHQQRLEREADATLQKYYELLSNVEGLTPENTVQRTVKQFVEDHAQDWESTIRQSTYHLYESLSNMLDTTVEKAAAAHTQMDEYRNATIEERNKWIDRTIKLLQENQLYEPVLTKAEEYLREQCKDEKVRSAARKYVLRNIAYSYVAEPEVPESGTVQELRHSLFRRIEPAVKIAIQAEMPLDDAEIKTRADKVHHLLLSHQISEKYGHTHHVAIMDYVEENLNLIQKKYKTIHPDKTLPPLHTFSLLRTMTENFVASVPTNPDYDMRSYFVTRNAGDEYDANMITNGLVSYIHKNILEQAAAMWSLTKEDMAQIDALPNDVAPFVKKASIVPPPGKNAPVASRIGYIKDLFQKFGKDKKCADYDRKFYAQTNEQVAAIEKEYRDKNEHRPIPVYLHDMTMYHKALEHFVVDIEAAGNKLSRYYEESGSQSRQVGAKAFASEFTKFLSKDIKEQAIAMLKEYKAKNADDPNMASAVITLAASSMRR